jgi:hypothetical protein
MEMLLDRLSLATPLGIRFWDPVRDVPITDHLLVVARRDGGSGRAVPAIQARSGVFVWHGLEGLPNPSLPAESGPAEDAVEFLVDVTDTLARFHAMRFRVPVPYRGVWQPVLGGSPAASAGGAFLLSTASRHAPAGTARVRADLWDAVNARGAAFALVEVQIEGTLWYGMADREGRAAVLFPYPRPPLATAISPPPPQPLAQAVWEIQVSVFYDPDLATETATDEPPEEADVRTQPLALIEPSAPTSPPADDSSLPTTLTEMLTFGGEPILRSGETANLFVRPVATSP